MPWHEVSLMDQRREFILLFQQADVNRRELCRRFGISSKTAYKWLAKLLLRARIGRKTDPRRPRKSPARSTTEIETAVLEVRDAHPVWGARENPALSGGSAQKRALSFHGSCDPDAT